jgi:DNA polymerase-3 subunit delta
VSGQAKPTFYLLRGDDNTRIKEVIAGFQAGLGDPSMADLNTTRHEGASLGFETLQADALTMPFLADRRLIIVENARDFLSRMAKERAQACLDLFGNLPETTALVMLVEDQQAKRRGERYWEHGKTYAWLTDWMRGHNDQALLIDCALPDEEDMPSWILRKAKELGGGFRPDAARLLASYVGNNTMRARNEVEKLITYVGERQVVEEADVSLLTAQEQEGDIFTLTDALGERNSKAAMQQFMLLMEDNDLLKLTGMIHRQFRLLIQAREILDAGGKAQDIERELSVLGFVSRKLADQARRFSMRQLLEIYDRLLKIDLDMKTGGIPGDVAYELLIADLTR